MKKTVFLALLLFILSSCSQTADNAVDDTDAIAYNWANISHTNTGVLIYQNSPLRFASSNDGKTIVLCDKPECSHERISQANPAPSCYARVVRLDKAILCGNRQILICTSEDNSLKKIVYTAETSGRQRKKIAEIDATAVIESLVYNNLLAMVCSNDYYLDDLGLLANMQNPAKNVAIVDLQSGSLWITPNIEGEYANITNLYIDGDSIYYITTTSLLNEETGYFRIANGDVRAYDFNEKKETILFAFDIPEEPGFMLADGYFILSSVDEILFKPLVGGDEKSVEIPSEVTNGLQPIRSQNDFWFWAWNDGVIFYESDGNVLKRINETPVNFSARYIIGENVYISGTNDSGEFYEGVIKKSDLKAGAYDNLIELLYPNIPWE
jgi:hypothetical protein